MELQVEGIYTAEPRFEAKAKALKLKQEMAAAAEEGRKPFFLCPYVNRIGRRCLPQC